MQTKAFKIFSTFAIKKSQKALSKGNTFFVYLTEKSSVFIIICFVNGSIFCTFQNE